MKKVFLLFLVLCFQFSLFSQVNPNSHFQRGYVKKSGTYVQPHYKTNTNKTNHDNYSTKGNNNTHTGSNGHRAKDYSPESQNYGKDKTIKSGSRGGQYYINDKGKRVYVPKR